MSQPPPSYDQLGLTTGDWAIDQLLDAFAVTCRELVGLADEIDAIHHRTIGVKTQPGNIAASRHELRACVEALAARTLAIERRVLPRLFHELQELGRERGVDAVRRLLRNKIQANARDGEVAFTPENVCPQSGRSPWA